MQSTDLPAKASRCCCWLDHCLHMVFQSSQVFGLDIPIVNWKFDAGKSSIPSMNGASSSNGPQSHQILCCAFNASGTVFVTGSSDTFARVYLKTLILGKKSLLFYHYYSCSVFLIILVLVNFSVYPIG